ncbi:MAG: ComF family protein [Gemmatimonadetes bacterium]|nr:ComF family protein [Gemmatimonadota bacterium]MBM4191107.1 ComF family protein [Gemmatimonadota bacterium]
MCAGCEALLTDRDRGLICGACWARLPRLAAPRCARCGHPRSVTTRAGATCPGCALLAPYVRAARSLCWVPHPVSSGILAALKYDGWPGVADGMGERMARLSWPSDVIAERAALVPVPLAATKQRERGFNQAERLASAVAVRWGIPVVTGVTRTRVTETQTRLTPGERLANVRRAFAVVSADLPRLAGRHVILVVDVLTTGATLNACAGALFAAGVRTVSYLTFGRARTAADH